MVIQSSEVHKMKSTTFAGLTLSILGIFGAIQFGDAAVNYCLSAYSCSGATNIGCNNTGALAPACPTGTKMVTITAALKAAILKSHNTKRNILAAGNLTGFDPAVRMATMVWDNDMALLASYNAKRCVFAHDQCRNTAKYKWSGQNIAKTWWSGGTPNDTSIVLPQIDSWWSEYKDTTMSDISAYPSSPSSVIGHFTVMTAEKNVAVGCAAIRFKDAAMNNWDSLTLVCNYARTNILGLPMYTAGPTASQCKTGKNPTYKALCGPKEVYTVNDP